VVVRAGLLQSSLGEGLGEKRRNINVKHSRSGSGVCWMIQRLTLHWPSGSAMVGRRAICLGGGANAGAWSRRAAQHGTACLETSTRRECVRLCACAPLSRVFERVRLPGTPCKCAEFVCRPQPATTRRRASAGLHLLSYGQALHGAACGKAGRVRRPQNLRYSWPRRMTSLCYLRSLELHPLHSLECRATALEQEKFQLLRNQARKQWKLLAAVSFRYPVALQ